LTARIGATGGRLHAGRSRNDQVLAALRLYMRDAAADLKGGAIAVADALDATRDRLGFEVTHEPVTAVQLSRGKAEAHLLFEITLLAQDLSRLAADLLLFYTQEFGFVSLPEEFTTGSSIMPQKRNPDVFELMRGRSAVAQAALNEVLAVTQKLRSGYHRDLQLIKPPLFRGIDSCLRTLQILPAALAGVRFHAERIRLDPS